MRFLREARFEWPVLAMITGLWSLFGQVSCQGQIGTGWTETHPKFQPQLRGTGPSYQTSDGVEIFSLTNAVKEGDERAEIRVWDDYSSGTHQFQGDLKVTSLPGSGITVKQTFQSKEGAWFLCTVDPAMHGTLRDHKDKTILATNVIGRTVRLNTIHDMDTGKFYVYVDGVLKETKSSVQNVSYNDKYGTYRSTSGYGPVTVEWSNVRVWEGGSVDGTPRTSPAGAPAETVITLQAESVPETSGATETAPATPELTAELMMPAPTAPSATHPKPAARPTPPPVAPPVAVPVPAPVVSAPPTPAPAAVETVAAAPTPAPTAISAPAPETKAPPAAPAPAPAAVVAPSKSATGYALSDAERQFVDDVMLAVKNNDTSWIADHMIYPLSIVTSDEISVVGSKQGFKKVLARRFTDDVRGKLQDAAQGPFVRNWQGVVLADDVMCFDKYRAAGQTEWGYGILSIGGFAFQPNNLPKSTP